MKKQSKFRALSACSSLPATPVAQPLPAPPIARLNRYTCCEFEKCENSVVTIERVVGTTPMFLSCDLCGGRMFSAMYKNVEGEPTHEWRKPTKRQIRHDPDHCGRGGLVLYPIREATS